jgi:hypothetical protein
MQPRIRSPRQSKAAWLLAFGLFAMAMTAMGGTGLMRATAAGGGFFVEICSAKGAGRIEIALPSGESSTPAGGHSDCCQLCAASAPLLLVGAMLDLSPAPAFGGVRFASLVSRPAAIERLSHPPRGPPSA